MGKQDSCRAAGWTPGSAMAAGAAVAASTVEEAGRMGPGGETPEWVSGLMAAGTTAGDCRGCRAATMMLNPFGRKWKRTCGFAVAIVGRPEPAAQRGATNVRYGWVQAREPAGPRGKTEPAAGNKHCAATAKQGLCSGRPIGFTERESAAGHHSTCHDNQLGQGAGGAG